MHTALAAPPYSPAGAPHPVPARRSVAECHALIEADLLLEDNSLEFPDGVLVPSRRSKHLWRSIATAQTRRVSIRLVAPGRHVRVREPNTFAAAEPEPDDGAARGHFADFEARRPLPGEVALIVEVANSTLTRDRDNRGCLYTEAGIPRCWILNLSDRTVEVYQNPVGTDPESSRFERTDYPGARTIPVSAIPTLVPPDPTARPILQGSECVQLGDGPRPAPSAPSGNAGILRPPGPRNDGRDVIPEGSGRSWPGVGARRDGRHQDSDLPEFTRRSTRVYRHQ